MSSKFLKSLVFIRDFFRSSVTWPIFMDWGNRAMQNEILATLAIITVTSSLSTFIIDVGMMSSGDVLLCADSISSTTSATVTGGNMVSLPDTGAGGIIGGQSSDAHSPSGIVPAICFSLLENRGRGRQQGHQCSVPCTIRLLSVLGAEDF